MTDKKRTFTGLTLTGLALVFLGAGCQQIKQQAGRIESDSHDFLRRAAQSHMTAVHLGQLAQRHGASEQVRQLGATVERDHNSGYQRLSDLALRKQIALPKGLDGEHQSVVQRFESLSGEAFDRAYVQHEIEANQQMLETYKRQAESGKDKEVRQYATDMLPEMGGHLEVARNVWGQLPPAPASAQTAAVPQTLGVPQTGTVTESHQGTTIATVTRYLPNQSIELKLDHRLGVHRYDLTGGADYSIQAPADLRMGARVRVTENAGPNQRASVRIESQEAMPPAPVAAD